MMSMSPNDRCKIGNVTALQNHLWVTNLWRLLTGPRILSRFGSVLCWDRILRRPD